MMSWVKYCTYVFLRKTSKTWMDTFQLNSWIQSCDKKTVVDHCDNIFSSPEHEVLMVSYWDSAVSGVRRASSVVNFLPCVRSRGHSFGPILMKVGQDVCLDEISDEFENGSCGVKN